jgi:hypothetical protein
MLPLGGSHRRLTPSRSRHGEEDAGAEAAGTRDATKGSPRRRRPFLERRKPATQKRPGVTNPEYQTGEAVERPGVSLTATNTTRQRDGTMPPAT